MKKSFSTLMLLMLAVVTSFSQIAIKPGIGLGFTDYVNFGNGSAAAKLGSQLGGSVAFGKKFYVEPGVFYSVRSTNFSTTESSDLSSKIKGIRVPVAVGLGVLGNEESLANLRVFGGASGFFVTGTENADKDKVTSPSWGAFVGAGVDVLIFYLDASYEFSLNEASSAWTDAKARTFYLTLGLKF